MSGWRAVNICSSVGVSVEGNDIRYRIVVAAEGNAVSTNVLRMRTLHEVPIFSGVYFVHILRPFILRLPQLRERHCSAA
jgi:hypothetical protein